MNWAFRRIKPARADRRAWFACKSKIVVHTAQNHQWFVIGMRPRGTQHYKTNFTRFTMVCQNDLLPSSYVLVLPIIWRIFWCNYVSEYSPWSKLLHVFPTAGPSSELLLTNCRILKLSVAGAHPVRKKQLESIPLRHHEKLINSIEVESTCAAAPQYNH